LKAIIAIDSFKGCLTSQEAGKAAMAAFPSGEATVVPISDGGEGFTKVITELLDGIFRKVNCTDPLGRSITAEYGLVADGRIAVIETAAASGLGLVAPGERNPLYSSSFGTGEIMADALDSGVEEIWLGLGGTATCDGGTGMLQALGYRFLTPSGMLASGQTELGNILEIESSRRNKNIPDCRITGFYDVSVPFFGNGGAAKMFAPQKGATPEMVDAIDSWMAQLCYVYSNFSGKDIKNIPGSGAAGGIGGALRACFRADMVPGVWKVLDLARFGNMLDSCSIVITGEGHSDIQTLKGKVPFGVLEYAKKYDAECGCGRKTKVYLLAGKVSDRAQLLEAGFEDVIQITPEGMSLDRAMQPATAKANIAKAVSELELF
jgi:glycerate kinase